MYRQIEKAPDQFLNSYYDKQLDKLIPDMHSNDHIKRTISIKTFSQNPNIDSNYFPILLTILKNELSYVNNPFFNKNIDLLIPILLSLNLKETYDALYKLIEDNEKDYRINSITQYIASVKKDEYLEKNKSFFVNKNNFGNALLGSLLSTGHMTEDYIKYFIKDGDEAYLYTLLNNWFFYNYLEQLDLEDLLRIGKNITNNVVNLLLAHTSFETYNFKYNYIYSSLLENYKNDPNSYWYTYNRILHRQKLSITNMEKIAKNLGHKDIFDEFKKGHMDPKLKL